MEKSPILAAALALLAGCTAGCTGNVSGGDSEPDGRIGHASSAVQGGVTDTSVAHNFAVGVATKAGSVCSGTLIAPNLVLTARHCVVPPTADDTVTCNDTFAGNVAPADLFVSTAPNLYKAASYYAATAIFTPTSTAFCGNDIAVVILATNVPETEAQPATPVVAFTMTDARLSGSITAMGYGITNPSAKDSGTRHIRQNIPLLCIPGSRNMNCTGQNAQFSDDPAEFVTAGHVCAGDSGSGAFDEVTFDQGTPYVIGALSRGPQTATECLAAVYSRTDAHAQLIKDAAIQAASQGNYDPPSWTAPSVMPTTENGPLCDGQTCTEASAADATGTTTKQSTSGCSVRGAGASGTGQALAGFVLAALGLLAIRRRRA